MIFGFSFVYAQKSYFCFRWHKNRICENLRLVWMGDVDKLLISLACIVWRNFADKIHFGDIHTVTCVCNAQWVNNLIREINTIASKPLVIVWLTKEFMIVGFFPLNRKNLIVLLFVDLPKKPIITIINQLEKISCEKSHLATFRKKFGFVERVQNKYITKQYFL